MSAAEPTLGPMGTAVADKVRAAVAEMLNCDEADLSEDTLEHLASKVAALGGDRLAALRTLAVDVCGFRDLQPNYSHRAVARLMLEGLAHVITTNWDCAIEIAGMSIALTVAPITSDLDNQRARAGAPLYKVHGTATRPETLRITQEEVDQPLDWAIAQTRSHMSSGVTVFAGLGTVGNYVSDPIEKILSEWASYAESVRIASPTLPDTWSAILGASGEDAHIAMYADDFFDDLLRAIVRDGLLTASAQARTLAGVEEWAKPILDEVQAIRDTAAPHPAEPILAWWRGCSVPSNDGRPFILSTEGTNTILAVGHIAHDSGGLRFEGHGRTFSALTDREYVEILHWPGAHVSAVMKRAEAHAADRAENGAFRDARPVTYAVVGAIGEFPSRFAESDIATGNVDPHDIAGSTAGPIHLVSVEHVVQGRLT